MSSKEVLKFSDESQVEFQFCWAVPLNNLSKYILNISINLSYKLDKRHILPQKNEYFLTKTKFEYAKV